MFHVREFDNYHCDRWVLSAFQFLYSEGAAQNLSTMPFEDGAYLL